MNTLELRQKRRGLIEKSREMLSAENITESGLKTVEKMQDEIDALENQIRQSDGPNGVGRLIPPGAADGSDFGEEYFSGSEFRDQAGNIVRVASHGEPLARHGEGENFSLGKFVRAMVTGDRANLNETETRAATVGVDAEGGYLVDDEFSNRSIDLSRSNMVVSKAGAQTVQMNSGELIMAKATADASPGWYGEGQTIGESEPTFG
jgi:HK97 family phage major capsid protein